jgi:SAM-dependent methyltransferase
MSLRADDPAYLRYQYSDDEKLRIRIETHRRYGGGDGFHEWVLDRVAAAPGHLLLDVGSGPGTDYHPLLTGVRVVAVDLSLGMLAKVRTHRVNADAQALPFADARFDRVMCNHMLYHVPDKPRALREMRRVVKRGGRVTVLANLRSSYANLYALRDAALAELGLQQHYGAGHWFAGEDIDVVRSVFPAARVERSESELVFPDAEPVFRFLATGPAGLESERDRRRLFDLLRPRIEEIVAREGAFRVPRGVGCFIADV